MEIYVDKVRTAKGMSASELSRLSGVSLAHIHYIERGEKMPSIKVICKIAKALEVHPSELFSCESH